MQLSAGLLLIPPSQCSVDKHLIPKTLNFFEVVYATLISLIAGEILATSFLFPPALLIAIEISLHPIYMYAG